MRFSKAPTAVATAVAAGMISAVLPVLPASADASVSLGLPGYAHMVVDAAHHHIFFSGGYHGDAVVVTDLDGTGVTTIAGEPGADGMALSPDGGTLYVALARGGAVAAIDTASLTESTRYRTGGGSSPRYVEPAGGRIWFSYTGKARTYTGNAGTVPDGGLGSVDVGRGTPSVTRQAPAWRDAPVLAADPADPGKVVAAGTGANADAGSDAAEPTLEVYDVSSGSAVESAVTRAAVGGGVSDMTVTPDGADLLVAAAAGDGVLRYRMPDLAADGAYRTGSGAGSVAVAPDGTVATGGSGRDARVAVVGSGASAVRRAYRGWNAPAGLAWDPDGSRLYAVGGGGDPALTVYDSPEQGDNTLTLRAPSPGVPGRQYTVGGRMTSVEPFAAGQTVHVTRTDAADPDGTELPDVAVASDGTFSFTDTATAPGDVSYQVSYDGDPLHLPAQATASIGMVRAAATVSAHAPGTAPAGHRLTVSGALSSPVPFAAGQSVEVRATDARHTVTVGTADVDADGSWSLATTPATGGPVTYTAAYPGDVSHDATSRTATVHVTRTPAAVAVTTDASAYAPDALATVTAHLGTPDDGRTVSVWAQPSGGTKTLVKTGAVDAHGDLVVTYHVTTATTFSVTYPGNRRYTPASATRTVRTYATVSDSLRGYYTTVRSGSTTYAVYHRTADPLQSAVVSPAKDGACVAFTVQEWYDHAWRTIASAGCVRTGTASTALARLTGPHPIGAHLRFRAAYGRTAGHGSRGSWVTFEFRA
ncbi:hypothetical protein POF50_031635 [Streptomyces sp. SL13]|uniref:Bacterial Ig-like domain-containing protein n=1 Tax=Streptantibioticus silvisoli TaxID=2705255 RepID=A0AA90K1H1_9ACTN|nr:hypothetical protein [Streptantibioticus silvisoli]MDI5973841.1 hypothetical protein [Streptantibioticus silvisoli]